MLRTTILCLTCLGLFAIVFPSAGCGTSTNVTLARVIAVTNLDDAGPGSLREALFRLIPGGAILFEPGLSGTITLTSGPLVVTRDPRIIGPGSGVIEIEAGMGVGRVFEIPVINTATIDDLTIRGGSASGILNRGTLNMSRVVIADCGGVRGGGLDNRGTAELVDCWIKDCTAVNGGGFANSAGTLTMTSCTVSGCQSLIGNGAGGLNEGILHMLNCTLSGNETTGPLRTGGGLRIEADAGSSFGDVLTTMVHCTVTDNTATGAGGGISVESDGAVMATLEIKSSIVAANMGTGAPDIDDSGVVTTNGFNVIGSPVGHGITAGVNGDQVGTIILPLNPRLDPLTPGLGLGYTPVHPLMAISPALDTVPLVNCTDREGNPVMVDQIANPRPVGGMCDAGSVERP